MEGLVAVFVAVTERTYAMSATNTMSPVEHAHVVRAVMNAILLQGGKMSTAKKDPELEILLHTLGLDYNKSIEPYRNHFVAGPGHSDMPIILRLIERGFMEEILKPGFLPEGDKVFAVTAAGIVHALKNRPHTPRRTRAQRRYDAFVEIADVYPDLTFREFLTHPKFEAYRQGIIR